MVGSGAAGVIEPTKRPALLCCCGLNRAVKPLGARFNIFILLPPPVAVPQASPLVAGLSVAAAALVGKQAVQMYLKFAASSGKGGISKQFYKVIIYVRH